MAKAQIVNVHVDYIHGQNLFFLSHICFLSEIYKGYVQTFLIFIYVLKIIVYMIESHIGNVILTYIQINGMNFV